METAGVLLGHWQFIFVIYKKVSVLFRIEGIYGVHTDSSFTVLWDVCVNNR